MILIADSGSTKTTWVDVTSGNKIVTEGLNPHFCSDEQILAACSVVYNYFQLSTFNFQLYFYGAGCGNTLQRERIERLLSAGLLTGDIHVETDMLGACRAVSGNRESIVAILGTGSNACYFDGKEIKWQPTSTGYIMGDNGSANHVGRILLNDFLTERMPQETRQLFHEAFPMTDDQLINTVYHGDSPNRFLASLAPFAVENEKCEYCNKVIYEALYDWYHGLIENICKHTGYQRGTINFVGSFAKAIEKNISDFLTNKSLHVGAIVADPIDGLREFHKVEN